MEKVSEQKSVIEEQNGTHLLFVLLILASALFEECLCGDRLLLERVFSSIRRIHIGMVR